MGVSKNNSTTRITCGKSPHGVTSDYYANVWQGRAQVGHGQAATRAEAIRLARADAKVRLAAGVSHTWSGR